MNAPFRISADRPLRRDLQLIAEMVEVGARVLDVGCGDGQLLRHLTAERDVDARGMEIRQAGVNACVAQGLSVVQGDADRDLVDYPDQAFDYVILSLTLQATRNPRAVLGEMLRVGRRAIVSFPNFGHWRVRLDLLLNGSMPVTPALDDPWYETPNIHLCTIRDFVRLCRDMDIAVERGLALDSGGQAISTARLRRANLFGVQALFLLARQP